MCLPNFIEFKKISKAEALVGYRAWINPINELTLKSINQDYEWPIRIVSHKVMNKDSGIYSYNYYNYNYYNYYYNNYNYNNYYYNNYYYNNNYYNYNYYNLFGIILQYGKVAIHEVGYRSQYAKIKTLFTIRESDAKGDTRFIEWVKIFNSHVKEIADRYGADTIHWQDFIESKKEAYANS